MGSGRSCHPISTIFTPSIEVLKTFASSEFCYYSISGLEDMHIKPIRGGTTPTFKKNLTEDGPPLCDPVYQITVSYLIAELSYGNLFVFD